MILSNQPQNEIQHAKTITTENSPTEINTSKQGVVELNDEQLEQSTGGTAWGRIGLDIATLGGYEVPRAVLGKICKSC